MQRRSCGDFEHTNAASGSDEFRKRLKILSDLRLVCDQVIVGIAGVSGERERRGIGGGGVRVELVIGRIAGDSATGEGLGDFGNIVEAMLALTVVAFLTGGTELVAVGMDFARRRNGAHGGESVFVVIVFLGGVVVDFHGGRLGKREKRRRNERRGKRKRDEENVRRER